MAERRPRPAVRAVAALTVALGLAMAPIPGPPWSATALGGARATPTRQAADGPQLPVDPDADPDRARRTTREILDGNEYQAPEGSGRSLLDRIREWFGDRLPELDGPGRGATDGASIVIVAVVVLGAAALALWVVRATRRTRRPTPDGDELDTDLELTPLRTAPEWTAEAERCASTGDHRGAVRARFRAVTATLVERDLVADTPGRTAGELRRDLAARAPEAGPAFAPLADLFERVWFGASRAEPEDSEAARRLAEAALTAAPRHPVAGASAADDTEPR